jgi:hypothetical protein
MDSFKIAYAEGSERNTVLKIEEYENFEKFGESLSVCLYGDKYDNYIVRSGDIKEEDGIFGNRCDASLNTASLLVIDADAAKRGGNAPHLREISKALEKLGINHTGHTSFSQTKDVNKCRVFIPCHIPCKGGLAPTIEKLCQELNDAGVDVAVNTEMKTWSQPWFFPNRRDPFDGIFDSVQYYKGKDYIAVEPSDSLHIVSGIKASSSNPNPGSSNSDALTLQERKDKIRNWEHNTGLWATIIGYSKGLLADGRNVANAISDTQTLMEIVPKSKRDTQWEKYYKDIPREVKGFDAKNKNNSVRVKIVELKKTDKPPALPKIALPIPLQLQHDEFRNQVFKPIDELLFTF